MLSSRYIIIHINLSTINCNTPQKIISSSSEQSLPPERPSLSLWLPGMDGHVLSQLNSALCQTLSDCHHGSRNATTDQGSAPRSRGSSAESTERVLCAERSRKERCRAM